MIKVVHIINNLNRGGAETLLLNIIKGLNTTSDEFEIRVLILEDKQHLTPQFLENNIPVDLVDCLKKSYIFRVIDIVKYLKMVRPDFVHTHLLHADKAGLLAAFLAGVKKRYSSVHDMEKSQNMSEVKARWVASIFAQKFIAVSNSAKEFCISNKIYPKNKITVIYNVPGFYVKNAKALDKKSAFTAIHVGRLHRLKGQSHLLKAFHILSDKGKDYSLTIYGVGAEYDALDNYIKKHHLTNVTLAGQTDNVPERLVEHCVFIASSISEGFNMALVEALSLGLPVIATKLDPHIEILTQFGDYPYLVDPANPKQIAEQVEKIASLDSCQYRELSELSIKLSQKFSHDEMIKNYLALYLKG